MAQTPRLMVTVVAGLLGLVMLAPEARAASLSVNPTKIQITKRAPRALLTVKNEGRMPTRVQITAHAWSQHLDGEMELQPTTDIVFFPSLLMLEPGQSRVIRIGTTAAIGASESSYRIFVEELPPASRDDQEASAVRLYTRLGIPVFLQPELPRSQPALAGVGFEEGTLSFRIVNEGTMHFVPESLIVRGLGASGEATFTRTLNAWYILAGGVRQFTMPVDHPECHQLRSLIVEAKVDGVLLREQLATPRGTCSP